jgi:hypothetical protein
MRPLALSAAALAACAGPERPDEFVGYRDGSDGGTTSGERGTVKITEVLWSGSVREDGTWDPSDVFIELRNESARPVHVGGWRLQLSGVQNTGWRIPDNARRIEVGEHVLIAAKDTGCFPDADYVLAGLRFPLSDPWELTLLDADERLMEGAWDDTMEVSVGGYDFVRSRSMERINLMFGGDANRSQSWHFYNPLACPNAVIQADPTANANLSCFESIPNNDRVALDCRRNTLASPGRPNSPDYSGAYASGSFE